MTPRPRRRRSPGEGGISGYQTKAGELFLLKYQAPTSDGLGTRVVLRRGFPSRTAAAAELRRRLSDVDKGVHVEPGKGTFGDYITDSYLPSVRLKPSTESSYRKNLRLHVLPHIGSVPLRSLTGQRLTALYRKLETEGRADGAGGLSPRTVRYVHTIVRKALSEAVENGLIATNPADKAKPPSSSQAKAPELRYWTPAQLKRFLAWSEQDGDDLFVAWQLLSGTGARRGEVLALKWGDIDLGAGTVAIRRNAVVVKTFGAGERIEIGSPKNDRARLVNIDSRTVAALKAHRSLLAELDLRLARDDALVLPARDGGVRHPERFSRTFGYRLNRARKHLGVDAPPVIRLHDLRHTHATALLLAGVHPKVVQERLGHSTIGITLDVYSHVVPALGKDAADLFAVAVWGA
jgi:integrase